MKNNMNNKIFIFDFDSTFIQVESVSILAEITFADHPNKTNIIKEIDLLTEQTMAGLYSFSEALQQRLHLFSLHRTHIQKAIEILKTKITPSIQKNIAFFKEYADQIYIISGGFYEIILPIAKSFGIQADHVFANHFYYNYDGKVVGIDTENPLAQDQGKVKLLKKLNFSPENTTIIGDGYNDYEVKEAGLAGTFYAFTENISREAVIKNADAIIHNLDGLFLLSDIAYQPQDRNKKVLLLENIHESVRLFFQNKGYEVISEKHALPEQELINALSDIHILGIRSKTKVTATVLEHAPQLEALGAFCIGTNQIDLPKCQQQGIAVFNAPYSNTRSVVELTLAEMILLMRRGIALNRKLNQGIWDKSSDGAHEVRGKTLGIIGYGNIGSQLSILAEAIGMNVIFYDIEEKLPLGNARALSSMEKVLSRADVVSIHVDGRKENRHLIGKAQFDSMKHGAIFLNLSRDSVIDEHALFEALLSGRVNGAGVDVFPDEPHQSGSPFHSKLLEHDNVFLTPHIGGSTMEAQKHIGDYVSKNLHLYTSHGTSSGSVNFPQIDLPAIESDHRIIHIHKNTPGVLAKINSLLASFQNNIEGQFLKTNEDIGYVITDINHQVKDELIEELKKIPNTIKVRKLS